MTTATMIPQEKVEELSPLLPDLEDSMGYTLADAMREGCQVTDQAYGWVANGGQKMCALSAAALAAKARRML